MARAWNHTLTPYTAEELAEWQEHENRQNADESRAEWLARYYKGAVVYWMECSSPRCHERPTHHATYDYVTGRAGRVSYARRELCDTHAARFAEKNGLAVCESCGRTRGETDPSKFACPECWDALPAGAADSHAHDGETT